MMPINVSDLKHIVHARFAWMENNLSWAKDYAVIMSLLDSVERLNKSLDDHLESEAAETRRADNEREARVDAERAAERLRRQLQEFERRYVTVDEVLKAKNREDEVVRLRENNTDLNAVIDILADANREYRTEIDKLRADLQRATSLPTASEAARSVALEAEVDRLRQLLRDAGVPEWVTSEPHSKTQTTEFLATAVNEAMKMVRCTDKEVNNE